MTRNPPHSRPICNGISVDQMTPGYLSCELGANPRLICARVLSERGTAALGESTRAPEVPGTDRGRDAGTLVPIPNCPVTCRTKTESLTWRAGLLTIG